MEWVGQLSSPKEEIFVSAPGLVIQSIMMGKARLQLLLTTQVMGSVAAASSQLGGSGSREETGSWSAL